MASQDKIVAQLESMGLSENESRVYFSMLSLGPATILNISRASEVKRTTVYNVLESLGRKGLTRTDSKGFKKLYVAEHPKNLEVMLERQKEELETFSPELEAIFNLKADGSFIKFYEGPVAVKNLYLNMLGELEHNDEFLVIGDPDKWESINAGFAADFIKSRNKIKLNIRMLLVCSETARKYKKFERNFQEEIKLLPENAQLDTNLVITPRKILIQHMGYPVVAMTIETESVVKMHKELFGVMWGGL